MVVTTKCAHCGAQITFDEKEEVAICKYCESVNSIHKKTISYNDETSNITETKEVLPELKYPANFICGFWYTQGGHIWINKEEIYFKPHKLNLGDLSKKYIRIQNICGYEKPIFPFAYINIHTNSGNKIELYVNAWERRKILNAIEERRKAYFLTRDLPIPELIKGSYIPTPKSDIEY